MMAHSLIASGGPPLSPEQVSEFVSEAFPKLDFRGKHLLCIIPDSTRTCPLGMVFKAIHSHLASEVASLDVMVALGTHPPMSEERICARLEMSSAERADHFHTVKLFNHEWNNPSALRSIGHLSSSEISKLSGGRFAMDVEVKINARIFEYDELLIIGPVFPHEVIGFSGGNKYLFPGVAGPEILDFFHWLGALVTNPMIIGHKWTPVRHVVDRAASLVPMKKNCVCMVVEKGALAGIFAGTPEEAWDEASELSQRLHIIYKERPFHTILSCAPEMYDDLWVGGKCMYKLEPVLEDGGELIIYAPHLQEISATHGRLIEKIGYHCRDYFLGQWERFKSYPWSVIAHSTHVRGVGKYENGVERCRVRVTLATGIPRTVCDHINLGWRDPASIDVNEFADREDVGILLVRNAGEMLFQLKEAPDWAQGQAIRQSPVH